MEGRDAFLQSGGKEFHYIPCLNDSHAWITALAGIAERNLLGWPTVHLTTIVALVLAYVQRGEAHGTLWEAHFRNLIETFWVALVIGIVAIPLCFVFVGIPLLFGLAVWVLYRTIKGLIRAIDGQPYV